MKEILTEVLEKIRPGENETIKIDKIYSILKDKVTKQGLKPLIVGSIAKGTNLKGADIDLFIKFDETINLKDEGLKVARKILPDGKELYAQHPYLRGEIEGMGIDVVPCYTIKDSSKSISAVDRTPFHTKWVNENIAGREDEVRLTKQFLKGAGAYGANAAVGGFSGYLVEILIIKYGNFKGLIHEISHWRPPVVIQNIEDAPKAAIMIKDPVGVINGNSPKYISCSLISRMCFTSDSESFSQTIKRKAARTGQAKVTPRTRHSSTEYLGSPKR